MWIEILKTCSKSGVSKGDVFPAIDVWDRVYPDNTECWSAFTAPNGVVYSVALHGEDPDARAFTAMEYLAEQAR